MTEPSHSGVELDGFLLYLVMVTLSGGMYSGVGYKGKQVPDNIHNYDVVRAIEEFAANPRAGARTAFRCWKGAIKLDA